ncbi:MAG: hypothetical protein ACOC43_15400 [Desulfohalobiaceae bacterium]
MIHVMCGKLGFTNKQDKLEKINIWLSQKGKGPIQSTGELEKKDASELIDLLQRHVNEQEQQASRQRQPETTAEIDEVPF